MRKLFSAILIIVGLAIILFPFGRNLYGDYQQRLLLEDWDRVSQMLAEEALEIDDGDDEELVNAQAEAERLKRKKAEERERQAYIAENIEAVLIIEKINLRLPVLRGTSQKNLLISAASLENTIKAGEVGNYAIAGHRNYGRGRHFNRLDELGLGDLLSVEAKDCIYIYEVTEKLYVGSDEVWVLEANGQDAEITLITCHPINNPSQRLVVKGKLSHINYL